VKRFFYGEGITVEIATWKKLFHVASEKMCLQ